MLPFPNFEQVIDTKVASSGHRYYAYGHITNIRLKEFKEWTAKVKGSQLYDVEIKIGNGYVEHFKCDCSDGCLGEVCKHVVAVLYHIKEDRLQTEEDFIELSNEVDGMLADLSKEDLKAFMVEFATQNKKFRERLMLEFGQ
ncbi:hypothetical protein [uncultured Microscilla sp.]|uniref:SWIM zinc finger family protein n=1 Tax=uncultured Microscilla sp. TaxID=432653 RepID=UPI00263700AF|nr:hypothetical protein [uncultured Microscilla sp.]